MNSSLVLVLAAAFCPLSIAHACGDLPPQLVATFQHRDPSFVDPGCLSEFEKSEVRSTKQSLVDAGVIAPCGSPAALPPDIRDSLIAQGILPRLSLPALTREQWTAIAAKGAIAQVNPWFLTAEEKNELCARGVPVPTLRSELSPALAQSLMREGALPRLGRGDFSAEQWEVLVRQGLVARYSRLTVAFFENKKFCYAFHGREVE